MSVSLSLGYHHNDVAPQAKGAEITYSDTRHGLIFGPTGCGKTTRWLLNNILSPSLAESSLVVIDPKAEVAAVSAAQRAEYGEVHIIDPFGKLAEITQGHERDYPRLLRKVNVTSAGFNPLAHLKPADDNFYDDAAAMAEALIQIEQRDSHWSQSAQGLIAGLIMAEKVHKGDHASLKGVRSLLTTAERLEALKDQQEPLPGLKPMGGTDGNPALYPVCGLRYTASQILKAHEIAERAAALTGKPPMMSADIMASLLGRYVDTNREIDSIKSTADTQTRWLLSRAMQYDLSKPGVDFSRLKHRITTVYIIIPAERMRTYSAWLRLLLVSALRSLYAPGGAPTTFFVDELPALGKLDMLADAFAIVRGFNMRIFGIAQDLAQLKSLYHDRYESLLANCGVLQFFAPNDKTTSEWVSWRSGLKEVFRQQYGETEHLEPENPLKGVSGRSSSRQPSDRPFYEPGDLIGMDRGTGVLYLAGERKPFRFFAPYYSNVSKVRGNAEPNPYYRADLRG